MIIRGPFTLTWGGSTLEDIEAVEVQYETNTEDYEANSGITYEIPKGKKAVVRLTLLATDILSLKAVLPQYFVAEGNQMADGSFVFDERGAIDITADDCDTEQIYHDLEIISCSDPDDSFKFMHARSMIDNIEVGKIRKVVIKFIAEPPAGNSLIQFLGDQGNADFFQLGDNDLFILGDENNLIL